MSGAVVVEQDDGMHSAGGVAVGAVATSSASELEATAAGGAVRDDGSGDGIADDVVGASSPRYARWRLRDELDRSITRSQSRDLVLPGQTALAFQSEFQLPALEDRSLASAGLQLDRRVCSVGGRDLSDAPLRRAQRRSRNDLLRRDVESVTRAGDALHLSLHVRCRSLSIRGDDRTGSLDRCRITPLGKESERSAAC